MRRLSGGKERNIVNIYHFADQEAGGLNYTSGSADNDNMKMRRSISVAGNEGGMTMIELSLAAVVLLGAVVIMMGMFNTAIDILRYTTSRSLATQISNQAMEDMRSLDYAQAYIATPDSWPDDPDFRASPEPQFKDIDDTSGTTIWRSIATTTSAAAIQVEETIVRQRITFIIHRYVMFVDDGSTSDAYKRMVVKVRWLKTPVPGEVVMTTNFAKEDKGESRPWTRVLGIVSTNYNYFDPYDESDGGVNNELLDTTMGVEDSIRGPILPKIKQPVIWTEAVITGAKASYIDRVEYELFDPDGVSVAETVVASTSVEAGRYYKWSDLDTTQPEFPDGRGYLLRVEAIDDRDRTDVDTFRFNIDNSGPTDLSALTVIETTGSARRLTVEWDWDALPTDAVPELSRFIVWYENKTDNPGKWYDLAAVPGTERSFIHIGLSDDTKYGYRVMAVDTAGNTSPKKEKSQLTKTGFAVDTTAPNRVTSATVEAASWNTIELALSQAQDNVGGSGMAGYEWWARDAALSDWIVIGTTTETVNDPAYSYDSGLKPGRGYYYEVRPFDVEGNFGLWIQDGGWTDYYARTPMR